MVGVVRVVVMVVVVVVVAVVVVVVVVVSWRMSCHFVVANVPIGNPQPSICVDVSATYLSYF